MLTLSLGSTLSWGQPSCGAADEAFNEISQLEVSSQADRKARDRYLLAMRNLVEVHSRLMAVAQVKPGLWICLSRAVNAFVIDREQPIFVMLGFLSRIGQDKDILAALLAHQLGHLARDHADSGKRAQGVFQYNASPAARSGLYGTYIYDRARRAGEREHAQRHFAFSREQENAADGYATILLARAGFRPGAMVKMMSRLLVIGGNKTAKWSDSHPGIAERLALVEPMVYDEEIDQLARSLADQGDRAGLARQIDLWLRQLPDSGNAWLHKAVFLEPLDAARALEAYERSLSGQGPAVNRTDEELAQVWLALCVGLFRAGHKVESATCSRRIRERGLLARFHSATFGETLFVGGEEPARSELLTARDRDGGKIITNDPGTLRARGLPASQTVAPWRAIRFPATQTDQLLQQRRAPHSPG